MSWLKTLFLLFSYSIFILFSFIFRPIIPFLQQIPPEVLLATARQDPLAAQEQLRVERAPTPATKNMMTQTDYRDSEAQTDPYTPEYVVRPGSAPELLTLATLSYGKSKLSSKSV